MSVKVQIQYFAVLREQSGVYAEEIETSATSYRELYDELACRYGFKLPSSSVKVAANSEFASMDAPVRAGADVVFIPPVAGG